MTIKTTFVRFGLTAALASFIAAGQAAGSPTDANRQDKPPMPLDAMIFPRPINVLFANPTCKTLDQIAKEATGLPPAVSILNPPVNDGTGKMIPFAQACAAALAAWNMDNPGVRPPYIPWSAQVILIKQGAAIEWLMLADHHGLRTLGTNNVISPQGATPP